MRVASTCPIRNSCPFGEVHLRFGLLTHQAGVFLTSETSDGQSWTGSEAGSVLKRQRAVELTVRAFCRQEQVSEASFYAWRRTILERDAEGKHFQPASTARPIA